MHSKAFTLNFVATLSFWLSAPLDLYALPIDFSEYKSILDANIWGRWHVQEASNLIESMCNRSRFFSRNPDVSYTTWSKERANWFYWFEKRQKTICKYKNYFNGNLSCKMTDGKCFSSISFETRIWRKMLLKLVCKSQIGTIRESRLLIQKRQ